jgi:toxin ParE1/3/4
MVELIWTDQASDDLGNIGDYIALNSEHFARLTIKNLKARIDILKTFPRSGRIVPEKNEENIRELIEGNYRIIYEIISDELIYILTVYHSARGLRI